MGQLLAHPEHGLNACQPICFYCDQPLKKFAFMGGFVPAQVTPAFYLGYEPCPACREKHKNDVMLVEVSDQKHSINQVAVKVGEVAGYPTGRYLILVHDEVRLRRLFDRATAANLYRTQFAFIWPDVYDKLYGVYLETGARIESVESTGLSP